MRLSLCLRTLEQTYQCARTYGTKNRRQRVALTHIQPGGGPPTANLSTLKGSHDRRCGACRACRYLADLHVAWFSHLPIRDKTRPQPMQPTIDVITHDRATSLGFAEGHVTLIHAIYTMCRGYPFSFT